ncbi:MAG: flagellar hook-associated protein FlgK [Candidatus Hydrogenedentota bacterium]|nr:MAG: flagellar hook-associated protein FlgK [Candidatus Hydrogenedentota bacterium]
MGTLFSTFDVARSGLIAAQVQLDTAGHNIANANKVGYSRQRVELVSRFPNLQPFGAIGTGVGIAGISRVRDEFLDDLYQNQVSGLGNAEIRAEFYQLVEDLFLEPSDNGLSARMNLFFDSLNEFSTNVESIPIRQSVMNEALALAQLFNDSSERLFDLRSNANEEVINSVPEINSLTGRIALLNQQISRAEIGGRTANDLRDDRGVLLDNLAKIVNIFTRERPDGQVDVLISGEVVVDANNNRVLEAVPNAALDPERNDLVEVRFADTGNLLQARDGTLFGALQMRDIELTEIDAGIDTLASTIIQQINLVQTQASGLVNLSGTITASNGVTDPSIALNTAGLPLNITAGSFEISIFDNTGTPTAASPATIAVGAGATLNDIIAAINAVPDLSASVNPDGFLSITVGAGFTMGFGNDSSGALASLGVNGLFTGSDARTMGVNQTIVDDPQLLASRFDSDPLSTGDNTAALAMLEVQNTSFLLNGTANINDFYESLVVQIGVDTRTNAETLQVEQTFVNSFNERRQQNSGVSLDEEVTFMIQYQRAFEASARVISVADRMLESLMTMAL